MNTMSDDKHEAKPLPGGSLAGGLRESILSLLQRLYPREFRIQPPPWPGAASSEMLRQWMQTARASVGTRSDRESSHDIALGAFGEFLADLATNAWRLREKMREPGTDQPREEMRRVYRHVEAIWASLQQQGVEIRDPTGEIVPEGGVYGLRVLASQPTPGITREKVLETIKPTIRFKNQVIQMGEVILAVPEKADGSGQRQSPSVDPHSY